MPDQERLSIYQVNLINRSKNDARVQALDLIEPKTEVLDVGCACGDFGDLLLKRRQCIVTGLEYSSDSLNVARAKGVYRELFLTDLENLSSDSSSWQNYQYEYIALLDVLEHLKRPAEVLVQLTRHLALGGGMVISLPNIAHGSIKAGLLVDNFTYTATGIMDETHVRFFTWKSIAEMLAGAGLEIDDARVVLSSRFCEFKSLFHPHRRPPWWLRLYIGLNLHSHVYQYVVRARISPKSLDALRAVNCSHLQPEYVPVYLHALRSIGANLRDIILPHGSALRALLKRLIRRC